MPERVMGSGVRGLVSTLSRLLLVAAVVFALVVIDPGVADAKKVPETLADQRPAQVGVVEVDFPIDFVAVTWHALDAQIDAHAHGNGDPESHGAVRFRNDGVWGRWIPFHEDGAQAEAQWSSSLVSGADAEAYQIRGVPAWAGSPWAMAINTTDGSLTTVDSRSRGAADSLSNCVSRAEWGADESYRFVDGVESWPTTFYPVQGLIVHHTVTPNDDPYTGAERIRAIYYQHAIGNDWGDIGYNYLIDEAGSIYEGRWSGAESTACGAGGDGADFAHNDAGDLVTGGHTAYYNHGNVGIALLGNFASPAEYPEDPGWVQVDPKPAAVAALNELLVDLVKRHGVDPTGMIDYANPMCDLPSKDWEWDCGDLTLPYSPGRGDPTRFK
ncbi:MAG TPA: N-acetylmuramoyl-L-alanine amidase, partial [Acidimicrobiia bacterium]|nr:N-acetylmuramoyl-L-alanine amidase [Acidimicrobiia bacterium]